MSVQVEFQLINSIKHGIVGRLFIPAALRGKGAGVKKGTLVYDSANRETSCSITGYKQGRTIEFIAPLSEYERLFNLYATSNMAANRVRTAQMLRQLKYQQRVVAEVKAQAATTAAPMELLSCPKNIDTMKDHELRQFAWTLRISSPSKLTRDELLVAIAERTATPAIVTEQPVIEPVVETVIESVIESPVAEPEASVLDLNKMTVSQLRKLAVDRKVPNRSSLKTKRQLIDAIAI